MTDEIKPVNDETQVPVVAVPVAAATPEPEEVPNVGASPAVETSGSDIASSAPSASQDAGIEDTAQGSQVGEAGNVQAPTASSVADSGSIEAVTQKTSSASSPVAAGVGDDSGNVQAGGVLPVATTSDSTAEPHPAKSHLAALRNKIESGEAIIMADLLRLIQNIEESL